jgi:hypothetical protein
MIVAIHQPNFFPWLGYFNKIARSDTFVILDNVQFIKTGGAWTNRVSLAISGRPAWVTMPVDRNYHGTRLINSIQIQRSNWRVKFARTLQTNYAGAPYFKDLFPIILEMINFETDHLSIYNINCIRSISTLLNLGSTKIVLSSELGALGASTELLINLAKSVGADTYMCGGGASGYQENELFVNAGIKLKFQNFTPPVYNQGSAGEFLPGLSIIDALLHCGVEGTRALVLTGD